MLITMKNSNINYATYITLHAIEKEEFLGNSPVFPLMAQHRKFLLTQNSDSDSDQKSYCYICYLCTDGCYISPPPPILQSQTGDKQGMSMILIIMLGVLGAALILLSYFTIGRFSSRLRSTRRRNSISQGNGLDFAGESHGPVVDHPIWHIRTIGLPQSVIDSIAVFKYAKGEGLIEGSDCSICLNEFREDESLRLLPKCSHAFHAPCIDKWLRSQKNCPVCRAPIVSAAANSVVVSSVETGPESSGSRAENESGSGREETNAVSENRIPINLRAVSDLADHHRVNVDRELHSVRRSASMDNFSSASIVYKEEEEEGSSNVKVRNRNFHGRSIQMGLVSMKRSLSFSGKRSLKSLWRSQDSIPVNKLGIHG